MQQTFNSLSIELPAMKRGDGAWADVARRRAEETVCDMRDKLLRRAALVMLKFDDSELLPPFVRAYFSTVARMFKDLCVPATLVVDIGNSRRVRYWLDGLMREESTFLLAYAQSTYHLFGTYPAHTEEVFYALLEGPADQDQLVAQLDADEAIVSEALHHLVDYRVAGAKDDGFQLLVPDTKRAIDLAAVASIA